ncbi:NEDD4-binding protein 1 [Anarrhichthys ocellatus]|uniref:NEDD4-binding protein 1 n=1 Tax=Anarrhichthys ocellatus TaxID=433405 RepID=UPI0012ECC9E5|nr:NEDD4-binding protein 1-like [Anarrhichthys ocellatus]XP_031707388.1 NEDD4-binding protein 1-like [Anarrhichthys ocellatus]
MDGERGDGGGGEAEVEDEFACAGMLRGSLTSLHDTVERIFWVTFGIGADEPSHANNGQIWLKLRGLSDDVKAAKLFVKGLVNQEEQQEVSYPGILHCIFCGARGLFMDCLTKNTSAHIVVGSTGFLLISGLAEPVVRAYSLITDLVGRYEGTQSRHPEAADRVPGESLDSRRAFKILVEKWEDKHILDLLVLPGSVKEILLDLVRESGLGSSPGPALTDGNAAAGSHEDSEDIWDKPFTVTYTLPEPSMTADWWVEGLTAGSGKDSASEDSLFQLVSGVTRGRAEGAEVRLIGSPQEVGEEQPELGTKMEEARGEEEEQELQLSVGNKEFWLLLKFFTAMGYTEDVVKRVLARTGPKEASQILDVVQQEQDRTDREQRSKGQDGAASNQSERNRPCETEHREDEEMEVGGDKVGEGATGSARHFEGKGGAEEKGEGHEEDFVLGVVKKAAASCGYMEQKVAKVYSMLPDRSTHQLLLELQREGSKETDALREGPREMDDVVLEEERPKVGPSRGKAREVELFLPAEKRKSDDRGRVEGPNQTVSEFIKFHKLTDSQTPHQVILPEVKGPPMPTYPSPLDPPLTHFQPNKQYGQTNYWSDASTSKQDHPTRDNVFNPKPKSSSVLKQALQAPQLPVFTRADSSPTRAKERRGFAAASPSVVVTGEQRFMEGLQMHFDLQLTDKPGDSKVRTIIIDGSNVAMSHGLGHFFSCRGIALAVQHFWDRGHRHISALLPQWRQKSDPKIKEQHYLTELQKLGLVSYTPSREVQGKRISSYDDRLMLQLAQKTDGVIVTNDNLRDLSDESLVWRDIIKKRLLQYTFVGDHFMVPDDPLGRGGPHLDDFLRSEHRTPDPGNHSFAGVATAFPSSKPPRSQTELLNFRDRTLGGASRGKGRGHGKGWDMGHQQGVDASGLGFSADRSPDETASLREQLCQVFPGQDNMVALVLQCHPAETDMNVLSDLMLRQ